MSPDAGTVAAAALVEAFGACVQGGLGFGINLVAAPLLELVDPRFVPAPLILAGLVSGLLVAVRERGGTDLRGVGWALGGRVPGTVLGLAVVVLVPGPALRGVVAAVVIVAVAASLWGWRLPMTAGSLLGAGVASGVMGTVAGLGGTPMGLVYQDARGPTVRATLARFTVLGAALSLIALAGAGRIGWSQLALAGVLLPGVLVGFLVSARLRPLLDDGRLRPVILALLALASLAVLAQALA
ncbi:MAG TPA: sulfite exporter TauE/SafE family protein [Acidimicrobiales bacterium]|nr:sulfite exporter TauE/SafE family protein [Acidimicrobiales bacterium]